MPSPTSFVGASKHPTNAIAMFDRQTGFFRSLAHHDEVKPSERYKFNSLGFRGEEYDSTAPLRIFVCGCSYTFGMGVESDHTWPVAFTRIAASQVGISAAQSHVQNFAQIGASNNYIARTLVKQCEVVPPTLAVAAFTHNSRVEFLDGPHIRNLGYWNIDPSNRFPEPSDSPGARFFRQYSERQGLLNLLTNMLLFQSAMIARRVPYIMVWVDIDTLRAEQLVEDPILGGYFSVLDQSRISRLSIRQPQISVDIVEGHPGPQSHARFARALAREFEGRLFARKTPSANIPLAKVKCLPRIRINRTSAERLTRTTIQATTRRPLTKVSLVFPDSLVIERFDGDRAVDLDLLGRAWTIRALRLREAFLEFITPELLQFNFWQQVLTLQEFMRAGRVDLRISVSSPWLLERGQGNLVLDELYDLLDRGAIIRARPRIIASDSTSLANRLEIAKRRVQRSLLYGTIRRVSKLVDDNSRDDLNIYPVW